MNIARKILLPTNRSTLNIFKKFTSSRFSTIRVKEKDDPETKDSTTTLIFNLDGTLIDTSNLLLKSMHTLQLNSDLNIDIPLSLNETQMGESLMNILRKIFGEQKNVQKFRDQIFLKEQAALLSNIFSKFIESDTLMKISSEHHETLLQLAEEGHSLVICSNYPQKIVDQIVDKHQLRRYFSQVVGGDFLPVCKPDPGHLVYSVEASGRDLSGAIMICDNLNDIKAAKAALIPIIAFPKNEKMKELMLKFHPEIFIDSIEDIPDALEQLMANSMY